MFSKGISSVFLVGIVVLSLSQEAFSARAQTFGSGSIKDKLMSAAKQSDFTNKVSKAIKNPEYVLDNQIEPLISPSESSDAKPFFLSLKDAIYLSLRYSPDIQSDELDRVLSRYQLRLKENQFELQYNLSGGLNKSWPNAKAINDTSLDNANVNLGVELNNHWGGKTTLSSDNQVNHDVYQPSVTLRLEQPLLRNAGREIADRALNDQRDSEIQSGLGLKQSIIDKVTSVIKAYRSLIQSNNQLKTQRQSLVDAKKTYENNKLRIQTGRLATSANIQQEYQIAQIQTSLQSQENSRLQARQSLLTAIGLDPNLEILVPESIELNDMRVPDEKKATQFALKHNTAYRKLKLDYNKVLRAYKMAKNQQLWQLDLTASSRLGRRNGLTGQSFNAFFNGKNTENQVGLKFSVPVQDLSRRSQLISAKLAVEKARLRLYTMKRSLEQDVTSTIRSIRTQVNLYQLGKKQLSFARQSYELQLQKQDAGISSSLDVTNSQNQLISAKNNLMNVKISYLNNVSSLEQKLATTLDVWKLNIGFLTP